jgi:hypothetical protein
MNEAEAIVSDHLVTGWTPNLVQRVIVLVRDDRDSLPRFVGAALRDAPDGVTLFDEALSFLSEEELAVAIELALQVLCERATSEAAESVIAHAAFHAPHLLTKHLRTCWELLDEYQAWTWRAADAGEVTRLLAIASTESEHAERAWRCLIETRDRDIVVRAANALSRAGSDPLRGGNPSYDGWLNHVGFTDEGGGLRELYSPTAFHLQFPAGFFDDPAGSLGTAPPSTQPGAPTQPAHRQPSPSAGWPRPRVRFATARCIGCSSGSRPPPICRFRRRSTSQCA